MDSKTMYPWSHPINLHEANLQAFASKSICESYQRAINYIIKEETNFPSLPVRLGLGYSFDEMALEMYRLLDHVALA